MVVRWLCVASEFICPGVVQVRFLWLTFAGRVSAALLLALIMS